jgi:hypothetical protein
MIVNAFVLPYPGRSVGVVFWDARVESRPPGTGPTPRTAGTGAAGDELAIYAPGELSPGEAAELHAHYVASIGSAMRVADRAESMRRPLAIWWVAGVVAALLITVRSLEFGIGPGWLAFAAALSALPFGAGTAAAVPSRRRVGLARRASRRAGALAPRVGTDDRWQQRVGALWQHGRRMRGRESEQLRELEVWCRENGWLQAAAFYGDQRRSRDTDAAPTGLARLSGWLRGRSGAATRSRVAYSALEMRAW